MLFIEVVVVTKIIKQQPNFKILNIFSGLTLILAREVVFSFLPLQKVSFFGPIYFSFERINKISKFHISEIIGRFLI